MTESLFDRKLFSKNGNLTESSYDRKLFPKNCHLTERSINRTVIWPKVHLNECFFSKNGHLTECSFYRKSFWLKVKQPWLIIRIGKAFLIFESASDQNRVWLPRCADVFVAVRCRAPGFRSNEFSVKWSFSEKAFGQMNFRSKEFSVKRPCAQFFFGQMTFFVESRFGQMTIFCKKKNRCDLSVKWTFGQTAFRSNELSVKWHSVKRCSVKWSFG
jgi:hypothetical protein